LKKQGKTKGQEKTKATAPLQGRRESAARPGSAKGDGSLVVDAKSQKVTRRADAPKARSADAEPEKRTRASRTEQPLPAPPSQDPIQSVEEAPPVPTYLTSEQLQEFRELLLEKRAELAGDVERLTAEARKENGFNEQSTMPIHMADLGTDNWEQDFTLGLIVNEQNLVREIDEALERIEKKTYGMCLATQKRITIARLRAKPWAKYCIEYERAREEGRAP